MPPRVSVNICCYNSEKFIKETIESVLRQTFDDFELVIIDDGSTDNTADIVKEYSDLRIKYFYQANQGLSRARNAAISLSVGDYIAFLDHDDLWESDKLDLQVKLLESHPSTGLVFSDGYVFFENNKKRIRFFNGNKPYRGNVSEKLINRNCIACSTVMARKELLHKVGPFLAELKLVEEYELFLRLSFITDFDYINKPLMYYRVHGANASRDLDLLYREELTVLSDLSEKNINKNIRRHISKRLTQIYLEQTIECVLNNRACLAEEKIQLALSERPGSLFFVPLAKLCAYLPPWLSQRFAWVLKKYMFLFKKIYFFG